MYKLLYNPLSRKGHGYESVKKLEKKLKRKKITFEEINLLDIVDKEKEYLSSINAEDIIVIIGGDGTIHQIVNRIKGLVIPNRIFMYRAGRGNDFSREHKGKLFEITEEIEDLPTFKCDNDEEIIFLNGIGMGIDAEVCRVQAENALKNIKESYFH